jgi:putative ABC transport system permease protein
MSFYEDVRFASRMLVKQRGLTAISVLTLGFGIGANTAMFSCADALLWKPLPLPNQDRLVLLGLTDTRAVSGQLLERHPFSVPEFLQWQRSARTLEASAAYAFADANLSGGGEPERIRGVRVTGDFFKVLPVTPIAGRSLRAADTQGGGHRVVVLSERIATTRFGGGHNLVGQTIRINGAAHEVVGIMPARFEYPMLSDVWLPLVLADKEREDWRTRRLEGIALVRGSSSTEQAQAELRVISRRISAQQPDTHSYFAAVALPLRININGSLTYQYNMMLLGAVGLVLLIACINVANLQLSSGTARAREIAVRAALGASRWRVVRLLLVESTMRALAGGALGLLFGSWGIELLRLNMPPDVLRFVVGFRDMSLDWRALLFTLTVALASGIVSGLAPALHGSRWGLAETLKQGGRAGEGTRRRWLQSALVVSQVAAAVVLAIGAALLVRGFNTLDATNRHLRPDTLLALNTFLADHRYAEYSALVQFADSALEKLRRVPGTETAAVASGLPYSFFGPGWSQVRVEGQPVTRPADTPAAQIPAISSEYFRALNTPLIEGRTFDERDGPDAPRVAIVNESFARQYLGTGPRLGTRLRISSPSDTGPPWQIVGVVADMQTGFYFRGPQPAVYRHYRQAPPRHMGFLVRAAAAPQPLIAAVRTQFQAVDPDQPLFAIKTMQTMIAEDRTGFTYVAAMMALLGALAMGLSAIGLYGLIAWSVSERTHEIGIRLAVGARARDVLAMVIRGGTWLTVLGLAIGLVVALGLARALASLFFGVEPDDVAVYVAVAGLLAGVALLACVVPARRAARLDPMTALRNE